MAPAGSGGVRRRWRHRAAVLAVLAAAGTAALGAIDFPEALAIDDPLYAHWEGDGLGFMTGGRAEFAYNYHAFSWSPTDIWNMQACVAFTPVRFGSSWALGAYYGAAILATPYSPGEPASNVIHFWLGALEFEYGLTGAVAIGPLHLTAEYSRTSLHDLKGSYSQVSTDDLKLGLVWPEALAGRLSWTPWLRGGSGGVELYAALSGTADSEESGSGPQPAFLAGLGARLVYGPP